MESRGKEPFCTSKIFNNGQTQVPKEVRHALRVEDGDKLLWVRKIDGYLVRGSAEPIRLVRETLAKGGITCKNCGTNFDASRNRCPKCGAPTPKSD